ncbi:hypothetical protein Tco_0049305 [Tanacetum coccineum]
MKNMCMKCQWMLRKTLFMIWVMLPDGEAAPNTYNAPKNNWFKQPLRPPTPDPEWNKCQIVDDQPEQNWFNDPMSTEKDPLTFDDLMTTPIEFSKFSKNQFKLDKITKADLVGQVYNLLMGTAKVALNSNKTWKNAIRLYLIDLIGLALKAIDVLMT